MLSVLTLGVMGLSFLLLPAPTFAQGTSPFVTCNGPDCTICSLTTSINNIIQFTVTLAVILATIILAYGGFKLVFSKGDPGAISQAKTHLINTAIGVILILAAWTLVDTLIKVFVNNQVIGENTQYGPWHRINPEQCRGQNPTGTPEREVPDVGRNVSTIAFSDEVGIDIMSITTGSGSGEGGADSGGSGGGSGSTRGGLTLSLVGGGTAMVLPCSAGSADRVSINFLGGSVQVHRAVAPSLRRIDAAWRARGGDSAYRVTSVGGYNCRTIAGSRRLSVHAYGLAVDINPIQNPYGRTLVTNMPPWFRQLFLNEGWGWGGNWSSVKDAMHFSKVSGEGGNMRGE